MVSNPQACSLTDSLVLNILRGDLLPLKELCNHFHDKFCGLTPEDFTYSIDGEPDGFFGSGLPHVTTEVQGNRFELVRPKDFELFADSGWKWPVPNILGVEK
jgi:hypothetical protein